MRASQWNPAIAEILTGRDKRRAPHGGDGRAVVGHRESPRFEAEPAVALQVRGVARLEVGREVLGVDELEVLREQLLADALPAVVVVRRDEAQVVVRLVVRMRVLEPEQPFEHDPGTLAEQLLERREDARLRLVGELGRFGRIQTEIVSALPVIQVKP